MYENITGMIRRRLHNSKQETTLSYSQENYVPPQNQITMGNLLQKVMIIVQKSRGRHLQEL